MTPRRDVEGEIYAQLYGEPAEPDDSASTRVIGDARREPRARENSVLGPSRRQSIETVAAAAAAGLAEARAAAAARLAHSRSATEARLGELKTAARDARGHKDSSEKDAPGRLAGAGAVAAAALAGARQAGTAGLAALGRVRPRGLSIGAVLAAVAVFVITLGAIVGLSVGAGGDATGQRASAPQPPPEDRSAEALADREIAEREASEEREADRRRAQRKRRTARRRAAERAEAENASEGGTVRLVCVRGGSCYPEGTVVRRASPDEGGEAEQPSKSEDDDGPSVRTNIEEAGSSDDGDPSERDYDIDVDVPELD